MRVVIALVPGEVTKILVQLRDRVVRGQILVEMAALGMIQKIPAPMAGTGAFTPVRNWKASCTG